MSVSIGKYWFGKCVLDQFWIISFCVLHASQTKIFFGRFEDYFANRVKQLTYTFPENSMNSSGTRFWSAPKRFPRPLEFSTSDLSHLHFIMAGAILRAETFGIPTPDWAKDPKKLAEAIDKVIVPEFQPKQGVKIETDEKATNLSTASIDDAAVINELIVKLEDCAKVLSPGFKMNPIQFEKVIWPVLFILGIQFGDSLVVIFTICTIIEFRSSAIPK